MTSEVPGADLVAKVPGRVPCIIHCSVFDPPDPERIERAAKSVPAGQPDQQLVVSSVDPGWDGDTYWTGSGPASRWIDYRDFLTALNGSASTIEPDDFDRQLIERYCASMTAIVGGLAELDLQDPHEPIEIGNEYVEHELRMLQLDGIVTRRRMHRARAMVREMSEHARRTNIDVVNVSGKPTLQQSRQLAGGDWIGWQYRGTDWRQFVRTDPHSGSSTQTQRERLIYVRNHYGQWFDPSHGVDPLLGMGLPKPPSEFKATGSATISRTWKVRQLSAADVARIADHLITSSYETFGG